MTVVGRTYLERGKPVFIVAQWLTLSDGRLSSLALLNTLPRTGPRNVLIRRENGELVVRPFRGLRRPPVTFVNQEELTEGRR